ncbi:hypothetical protein [Nonomuraea maritima]|uniref:hypothetical protein n=1 Tax=Nonomuraea maritima TaxID=683260 RepID=UPI003717A1F8
MRFTETTTLATPSGRDRKKLQDRKGTFPFSAKGIAASDITANQVGGLRERGVSVGKTGYISGGILANRLPPGASWSRTNLRAGTSGFHGKVITIDSRFTGWGSKASIKAPDPKDVADLAD